MSAQPATPVYPVAVVGTARSLHFDVPFDARLTMQA